MKEIELSSYLKNPCRASSLPYWKQKYITVPKDMRIVHDSEYDATLFAEYNDERYFRLYHDLKNVDFKMPSNVEIVVADSDMTNEFVQIINASYDDLSVSTEQLGGYRRTSVFCPELWALIKDVKSGAYVACCIADFDKQCGEMIIEWLQILPAFRKRGYGQLMVKYLLNAVQGKADFATVSGNVDNPTNPEDLYRKCGFTGTDIWHILHRK